jgi:hypothetical protein
MSVRNRELASFLKSRRKRLTPADVGLPEHAKRRLASLRREEVAWLADVGITWYTWLEQGRRIRASADTLERIAGVLRLDASEREYLKKLVQSHDNGQASWSFAVPDRVRLLIESYEAGPAFVMGARWDVLACNSRFATLFRFKERNPGLERNALWSMFTWPAMRLLFPRWLESARQMVGSFRVTYADFVGDTGFEDLIRELLTKSAEFASMWSNVDVVSPMRWSIGELRDPQTGVTTAFETVNFSVPDGCNQTAVFFCPRNKGGIAQH